MDGSIRVGISGAAGVGKTTLVDQLTRCFPERQVKVSKEIARTLAKQGIRINLESQLEDYLAFLAYHLRQTREMKGDLVIFDRTLIDVLCFMELLQNAGTWAKALTEELVRAQMKLFACYFHIPPEFTTEPDGVRITDRSVIKKWDLELRRLLAIYRPDFVTLTGPLSDRVRLAKSVIDVQLRNSKRKRL